MSKGFHSQPGFRAYLTVLPQRLCSRRGRRGRASVCFANAKTLKEGEEYEIFCGGLMFYFGKVDSE